MRGKDAVGPNQFSGMHEFCAAKLQPRKKPIRKSGVWRTPIRLLCFCLGHPPATVEVSPTNFSCAY